MEERVRPTRTGLFSIEMTIAIGIFTLCAAICIGLFIHAEVMSRKDADTVRAITEARNVSECFKAAGGDLSRTAELTGARLENGQAVARYDGSWKRTAEEGEDTLFHLMLEPVESGQEGLSSAKLTVTGERDETLLSWNVTAWEVAP